MRVLIVPDKFKGTLTASQAATAIARGWRRARPADTLDLLPMSDGGDGYGRALREWPTLANCKTILPPEQRLVLGRVTVAVDVANPLLGGTGCTRVYGPQKGLRPRQFGSAERSLRQLAAVVETSQHRELANVAGAGAAGGLGFGLMAFVHAEPEAGFDIFAKLARLHTRIRRADLVVTGEGALDDQSLMGKGVGRIADACREAGTPCVALAGVQNLQRRSHSLLQGSWALCPDLVSCAESLRRPAFHLARLAAQVAANTLWT